ncbi:MAG: energy transducer TonB [Gemmatimonadota bacterium]
MLASRDREGLSEELRTLRGELESIEFQERPSFGPELRAELEAVARAEGVYGRRRAPFVRPALLAASAVLLTGLFAVPSARASIVELIGSVQTRFRAEPPTPAPVPVALDPPGSSDLERDPVFIPLASVSREEQAPEAPAPSLWDGDLSDVAPFDAYPVLLDREGVDELVRWFYPDRLEDQGVVGVVRLILWVEADGSVDDRQISSSSGIAELDTAALKAAEHFRFTPARRRGQPVGTWVEFDVNVQSVARRGS